MRIDDGHFPRIKPYAEYDINDAKKLVLEEKWAELTKVIDSIEPALPHWSPRPLTLLAGLIHDKSHMTTHHLHHKMASLGITPTSLALNYFLYSAAHFRAYDHLVQLLYQCTITDVTVDLNTYLKVICQVYFDSQAKFERKDFITYLYLLFNNDHTNEDY